MSDIDLAYTAGLVDGEGCIAVYKAKGSNGYPNYELRVTVANTNKVMVDWLHKTYGGFVHTRKAQKETWKPCYVWVLSQKKAETFLYKLLPYLKIKAEQASVSLEFRQTVGLGTNYEAIPESIITKRSCLMERLRVLNQKGVSV